MGDAVSQPVVIHRALAMSQSNAWRWSVVGLCTLGSIIAYVDRVRVDGIDRRQIFVARGGVVLLGVLAQRPRARDGELLGAHADPDSPGGDRQDCRHSELRGQFAGHRGANSHRVAGAANRQLRSIHGCRVGVPAARYRIVFIPRPPEIRAGRSGRVGSHR